MLLKTSVLLCVVAVALQTLGLFDQPSSFQSIVEPEMTWCLSSHKGSFKQIGHVMPIIGMALKAAGVLGERHTRGVGVFFNNPDQVPEDELSWMIGYQCQAPRGVYYEQGGVRAYRVPQLPAIEATFPWRHMFTPILASARVWPAMHRFLDEKNLTKEAPFVEFYDADEAGNLQTIRFVAYQDTAFEEVFVG